jgi:hypothetical protein
MRYDNPLKWLLYELPAYIEPGPLSALMERYEKNKRCYEQEIRIRHAERVIATTERFPPSPERDARLARWQAKLSMLQEGL